MDEGRIKACSNLPAMTEETRQEIEIMWPIRYAVAVTAEMFVHHVVSMGATRCWYRKQRARIEKRLSETRAMMLEDKHVVSR